MFCIGIVSKGFGKEGTAVIRLVVDVYHNCTWSKIKWYNLMAKKPSLYTFMQKISSKVACEIKTFLHLNI